MKHTSKLIIATLFGALSITAFASGSSDESHSHGVERSHSQQMPASKMGANMGSMNMDGMPMGQMQMGQMQMSKMHSTAHMAMKMAMRNNAMGQMDMSEMKKMHDNAHMNMGMGQMNTQPAEDVYELNVGDS